ncbi:TonB-dependent receptor plug domain-containing protein [Geomonas edaphica]|uniref:TonB-dependent receptor plug domain-containing protein n=1 Tax=Geomonas edaphica TaxID=2570226 RepID=UPI001FE76CB7|nr:TonB-dependent receptor [Geomonas edaphica]
MSKRNDLHQASYAIMRVLLLSAPLLLVLLAGTAYAGDDLSSLELYNGPGTEILTGSRSPRPASQTAENITVVTSKEIEDLNAHTLADVLYSVTGVQVEMNRTPGTVSNFRLQGAGFNHVLVLIDSIPINSLADNFPDISSIPAQMIERVEIVKGAASSSWGSALGGVINVITKEPQGDSTFGGLVSGSLGTRETVDGRVEANGALQRFGYYLTAGKLRSDGLLPNNGVDLGHAYGKLRYELPAGGEIAFNTGFSRNESGQIATERVNVDQYARQLISMLALRYPLTHRLVLDASLQARRYASHFSVLNPTETLVYQVATDKESSKGGTLKLSWLGDTHRLVGGIDYDHVKANLNFAGQRAVWRADRVGVFLIDTITLGAFAITPSARFDRTGSGGDHFSPSFGVTYAITENSVLRAYTAKGYSLTSLNRDDSTEKVWTSQVGFETGDLPYLWFKGTMFRNDTSNIQPDDPNQPKQRQLKEGVEVEAKTVPVWNTSLSAGYTFVRATDKDSDRVLHGVPVHTLKIGLRYDLAEQLHAEIIGTFVDWNAPQQTEARQMIWDLHLSKRVASTDALDFEVFLSLRNLLDGRQYLDSKYQNAGRWGEAGVRCKF